MSYEINIISVGQTAPSSSYQPTELFISNEVEDDTICRYHTIWPVFSHTAGILYSLEQEMSPGFLCSFPICDADFEADVSPGLIPDFVDEKAKDNLTPMIIFPKYYSDVEKCIEMLVHDSPCKTILFQTRYEWGNYEIFYGAISLSEFLKRLKSREILFNVCYIVTEDSEIQ